MTNYNTLLPYTHRAIEDWGCCVSDDFKSFARKWRNYLKRVCNANGWDLVDFSANHYECSWFIKNGDKYIYCSFSDVRYFSNEWYKLILYRTAQNDRDYRGGSNNYTDLHHLESSLSNMFAR